MKGFDETSTLRASGRLRRRLRRSRANAAARSPRREKGGAEEAGEGRAGAAAGGAGAAEAGHPEERRAASRAGAAVAESDRGRGSGGEKRRQEVGRQQPAR